MIDTGIEKQISDGLIDILASLQKLADKYQIDKELPKVLVDYYWMEEDEKGNGRGKHAQTQVPLLYKADTLLEQLFDREQTITAKVIEFGENAKSIINDKSFPAFIAPNIGSDPLSVAKLVISNYIQETGSLRINKRVAKRISREFVNDLSSPTYTALFIFLIHKFKATKPFQLNTSIKFRPINESDYKQFSTTGPGRIPSNKEPWLGSNDWICLVESEGDKSTTDAINSHRDILEKITGALALTTSGRASFFLLSGRYKSRFFNFMETHGGDYVHTSGVGGVVVNLDEVGLRRFRKTFKLVESIFDNSKYKVLRLPFRRLRLSSTRGNDNDKFVDYVIGLERLLAADSENLEVTFRFRLRGAALLPKSFGTERDRLNLMSKLYGIRSNIVHGREDPTEVRDLLLQTEQVFVAIFRNYSRLLSTSENESELMKKLDEALIKGGSVVVKRKEM